MVFEILDKTVLSKNKKKNGMLNLSLSGQIRWMSNL